MLGRSKILCGKSGLNAQHGHHAHKCLKKSPEPVGRFSQNLVCSIRDFVICSNDGPRMTLTNLYSKVSLGNVGLYMGEKVKTMDILETTAV